MDAAAASQARAQATATGVRRAGTGSRGTGDLAVVDVAPFSGSDCDEQKSTCSVTTSRSNCVLTWDTAACDNAQRNAPFQTFALESLGADPLDPDFELLCAP